MQHWIAFQLLHALAQCHERGVCHGDIKCDNVLVTSWDWVYLADFASYKPVRLLADNPVSTAFVVLCCSLPTDSDVRVGASHELMVMLLVFEASDILHMLDTQQCGSCSSGSQHLVRCFQQSAV